MSVEHPIAGDELRAIKRYLSTREDKLPWLFISERGTQLTRQACNYLVREAAAAAGLKNVHPHTLRLIFTCTSAGKAASYQVTAHAHTQHR